MPRTVFAASTWVDYTGLNVEATEATEYERGTEAGLGLNTNTFFFFIEHSGSRHHR